MKLNNRLKMLFGPLDPLWAWYLRIRGKAASSNIPEIGASEVANAQIDRNSISKEERSLAASAANEAIIQAQLHLQKADRKTSEL